MTRNTGLLLFVNSAKLMGSVIMALINMGMFNIIDLISIICPIKVFLVIFFTDVKATNAIALIPRRYVLCANVYM